MPRDDKVNSSDRHLVSKHDVLLPKVSLKSMTKAELKAFIPQLLRLVTGRETVFNSQGSSRPKWWPSYLKWVSDKEEWMQQKCTVDKLRVVVRNCYRHLDEEQLLCRDDKSPGGKEALLDTQVSSDVSPVKSVCYPSPQVRASLKGIHLPFSTEIYICYFCEREFISKVEMRAHQRCCDDRPPELLRFLPGPAPRTLPHLQAAPPLLSPSPDRRSSNYPNIPRQKFAAYLDLLPEQKAAKLKHEKSSVEVNCEVLDDEFEPQSPTSPISPRTPKSLISQMSREDVCHLFKKRSYSLSVDTDKLDSSDSENDENRKTSAVKEKLNFLNIDITSLLGQRIQKHVHVDSPVQVIDFRNFCKTPVKNRFLEKLRQKPLSYPIVYKPRRIAALHKQGHTYKFTKGQTISFTKRLNTGLDEHSRKLLKCMKRLRVHLPRMTMKEMLKYVPLRILERQLRGLPVQKRRAVPKTAKCEFPPGPILLARNIEKLLGLKKRSPSGKEQVNTPLSLGHVVSEEMEAEVSKQKLTLYRCLLYEMSLIASPKVIVQNLNRKKHTSDSRTHSSCDSADPVRKVIHNNSPVKLIKPSASRESQKDSCSPGVKFSELKSLLTAKTVVMANPVSSNLQRKSASCGDNEGNSGSALSPRHGGLDSIMSSPDSASVCGGMCSPVSPAMSPPVCTADDSLSVISVSSDSGTSLNSNCCHGCAYNKHNRYVLSSWKPNISESTNNSPIVPQLLLKVDVAYGKTLRVDVENELPSGSANFTSTEMAYGVPSPVSVVGEFPLPLTPTKGIDETQMCSLVRKDIPDVCDRPTRSSVSDLPNVCDRPMRSSVSDLPDVFTQAEQNEYILKRRFPRKSVSDICTNLLSGLGGSGSPGCSVSSRSLAATPVSTPRVLRTRSLPTTPQSSSPAAKRHIFGKIKQRNQTRLSTLFKNLKKHY